MPSGIGSVLQSAGAAMPSFLGGPGGTMSSWASGLGDWMNPAGAVTPFGSSPNAFAANLPNIPSLNIGGDSITGSIGAPSDPFTSGVPAPTLSGVSGSNTLLMVAGLPVAEWPRPIHLLPLPEEGEPVR